MTAEDLDPCSSSCPPGDSLFYPPSPPGYDAPDHCYGHNDDSSIRYSNDVTPVSIFHNFNNTPPLDSSNNSSEGQYEESAENIIEDHDKSGLLPTKAKSQGGSSTLGSIFLIVNAALGAGLLNMPKAFDQAGGVMTAVLVQGVLLVFIMMALLILAQTANINKSTTLQEVRQWLLA